MKRLTILLMLLVLGSLSANAQNQQKEYITFSDTKGKVIDCKGRAGFQGATLTIRYPTLAAYQKQYSKHYLVLDPDPPKNLTLEQGGFDGPCSNYYLNPLPVETKKIPDPSDNYPKAPSLQSAMVIIKAWIEFANQTKPSTKWVNGYEVGAGFSIPYCSKSNSLRIANVTFDDKRQSASYDSLNDRSLHAISCKPDDESKNFGAIAFGYNQNDSVALPGSAPIIKQEQLQRIKFFSYDFCSGYATRVVIVNGKEYIYNQSPLVGCKANGKAIEIDFSNEKYPSYK